MEEKIKGIIIVGENTVTNKQKNHLKHINDISIKTQENRNNIPNLLNEKFLLIINLSEKGAEELERLIDINQRKASVIIIGNKQDANLLSIAISAEISAFLDTYHQQYEFVDAIDKALFKLLKTKKITTFNVFINAKGGAGASFICSNMAYVLSQIKHSKVALLDMDLQFGSLGLNFNINIPKYTFIEALSEVNELDKISLSGYMEKYNDFLSLLLPSTHDIVIPGEVNTKSVETLLDLLADNYNHLIIDLPRLIDPLSMMIMNKTNNIVIVLQQNLAQFRDGRRLIHILNNDLDIALDKIIIVINRYDKNNPLKKEDMVKLVEHDKVYTICNDFELVATTSNLGVPLCEHSPNSQIAKDLKAMSYAIDNLEENKKQRLFSRFFPSF